MGSLCNRIIFTIRPSLPEDMEIVQTDLQDLRRQLSDYDGVDLELECLRKENCTLRAQLTSLETDAA